MAPCAGTAAVQRGRVTATGRQSAALRPHLLAVIRADVTSALSPRHSGWI